MTAELEEHCIFIHVSSVETIRLIANTLFQSCMHIQRILSIFLILEYETPSLYWLVCCLYIFDSIDTHNITLHTHALSLTSVSTIKNPLHQVHHSCRHPECTSTHHYRDVSPLSISPMTLFTLSSFLTHSRCCALLPVGIDVLCPPWTVGGSSIHGNVLE
mgnify:FL=1